MEGSGEVVEMEEVEEVALVAAAVEVVVVVVPPEVLLDVHQVVRRAVPDPEVPLQPVVHLVRVCQVILGLVVSFHPVMGPPGRRQLSRSSGSSDQTGYLLNPIIPVRVRVPAS